MNIDINFNGINGINGKGDEDDNSSIWGGKRGSASASRGIERGCV
ncbi:hypothetical protein OK074_8663 [Actinobacteria bacterium OK074]|nr:hypothetical protein OK074_8663 [Actinobacteria bacterium OK074]